MKTFLLALPILALAQVAPEVTTTVQLENFVFYKDETGDATKLGSLPGPVPIDPQIGWPFRRYAIVADVVAVGGRPAAGTFLAQGVALNTSNAAEPRPNFLIADLPRNQMHNMILEIMTPEKAQVGALYGFWMGAGGSAPGAPTGGGVLAILGGTGAYVGVHGQGANVAASNLRQASMLEDTSRRRVNGGGRMTLGINLSGTALAEVTSVAHADFTPVTASSPARSGEVLILQVKAGWPVQPPLQAGQVFSGENFSQVTIPVAATMNDITVEILNTIGWPGSNDRYRVDLRVPGGVGPGTVRLQVSGGYLPGVAFNVPVM